MGGFYGFSYYMQILMVSYFSGQAKNDSLFFHIQKGHHLVPFADHRISANRTVNMNGLVTAKRYCRD